MSSLELCYESTAQNDIGWIFGSQRSLFSSEWVPNPVSYYLLFQVYVGSKFRTTDEIIELSNCLICSYLLRSIFSRKEMESLSFLGFFCLFCFLGVFFGWFVLGYTQRYSGLILLLHSGGHFPALESKSEQWLGTFLF